MLIINISRSMQIQHVYCMS